MRSADLKSVLGLLALAAAAATAAPVAHAAGDIDYDARRAAELRPCDQARYRGQTQAARDCYRPLLNGGNALVRAEAAFALDDLRTANDLFRLAVEADPAAVLPRVRWGRMFLSVGQHADALNLFNEALERDDKDAGARLAMARVAVERFDGDVAEEIQALLSENPDLVEAHLIAARLAVERARYDDAVREAQQAQQLAEAQGYPPLEALELLAAIEVMRFRDPAASINAALAYNPRYGAVFETLGRFETLRRRYREADEWLQRGAQVQPDLWSLRRELGLNLMRLGRLDDARTHLEAAYGGDPFSTTTVNTLRLLDSLERFEMIRVEQPAMNLQLHRDEARTLGPYVEQLSREAIETFSRRYGYTPTEPVTIELYPDHDDFAVRTAGLPGIGLLGVAFGHLVAMDSPAGRRTGDFHWGNVLWHELAHVFTLSVTGHRVPRWLSEGLSVYEEWTTGPAPGVLVTPPVLDALAEGKLLPVDELDNGFMRPTYSGQVQVSYDQAGLVCLFAAETWGFERMVQFLHAFRTETTTALEIRRVFEVEPAEFDRRFQNYLRERFAAYLADPARWRELMARGHQMLESRNWAAARTAAQAAILMLPEYTSPGSAYEVLAQAEEEAGNAAAAIAAWERWREAGGWEPSGLRKLGALLIEANRPAEAADVLMAVNYVDPLNVEGRDRLGQLLVDQQRGADALREYQVLLAMQPLDTATANFGLARAYRLNGDLTRARRHLLLSLETAPNFRPAQRMLLEMTGDRTP